MNQIAVVGIDCRFPGAPTADVFFEPDRVETGRPRVV